MKLHASCLYLWPYEGHQTFQCRLRIFRDESRDLVVASDWGSQGEVDSSITDDFARLYQGVCHDFRLGGTGREVLWFEHYCRGWERRQPHPSGQPGCGPFWSRVLLGPAPAGDRRVRRQPHSGPERRRSRKVADSLQAVWQPCSESELHGLVGEEFYQARICPPAPRPLGTPVGPRA